MIQLIATSPTMTEMDTTLHRDTADPITMEVVLMVMADITITAVKGTRTSP
jgi:hypothetical protein